MTRARIRKNIDRLHDAGRWNARRRRRSYYWERQMCRLINRKPDSR